MIKSSITKRRRSIKKQLQALQAQSDRLERLVTRNEKMVALYRRGVTLREIAKRFGVAESNACRTVRDAGVERRSDSWRKTQ
jgi:DNA-binding NarL/FixJ family response regulator